MNYLKHYQTLIDRAKNRKIIGYSERHHIIPKCMNGNDNPSNISILTAREHYVAHILLAKIYGGTLWHAVNQMGRLKRYTNRLYERARIEHSKLVSIQNKRVKTKPKEIRQYHCVECHQKFEKLEFSHYPIRSKAWCSQGCAAKYNGKTFTSRVSRNKGNKAWNKGLLNPQAAINGKKSAAKLSITATGRKRLYKENGKWTWEYPNKRLLS